MSVRTFHLDGKTITALEGQTIFAAAWESGIRIPHLCHLDGLSDVGACRLCLVQIEGQKRLQPSCMSKVAEDMVVYTDTPALRAHRKLIVELLFAERNHICSVCVLNGGCELQDLAAELGIDHIRLNPQYPKLSVDISHERFGLDHNRCMLCTRCVRVCDEVEGAHTWDVAGRGRNSRIISDLDESWGKSGSCTSCGKCVQVGVSDRSAVFKGKNDCGDGQRPKLFALHRHRSGEEVVDRVKPRLATAWLAGCSGCHMSFLDLDERLIELARLADVCYSPIADIKQFPENVDVTLVEGAVANEENLREIRLIRERTKTLVAFGDCAVTGNVTAIRNLFGIEDVLQTAYGAVRIDSELVPRLLSRVLRVQDIVSVDYFLPGCPPPGGVIFDFLNDLLSGRTPVPKNTRFGA